MTGIPVKFRRRTNVGKNGKSAESVRAESAKKREREREITVEKIEEML